MTRSFKITYWVSTLWLSLGMVSTGLVQLMKMKEEIAVMNLLGFPESLLTLLGVWKLLGVVAILIPKFPLLKEWAYAGFIFMTTGAIYAHLLAGDAFVSILPASLLLVLTMLSWYFRPESKKTVPSTFLK